MAQKTAKELIVAIPGLICTRSVFRHQLPMFEALDYDVVIPNHSSERTIHGQAKKILRELPKNRPLSVLGFSYGGYLSLEMYAQEPERFARLALVSTQARGDSEKVRIRRKDLLALAHREQSLDSVMQLQSPLLVGPDHLLNSSPGTAMGTILEMAKETSVQDFENQQHAIMTRTDRRSLLSSISCPVTILAGEEDALIPAAIALEMATRIRTNNSNVVCEILKGSGHMVLLEKPEPSNEILNKWLKQ